MDYEGIHFHYRQCFSTEQLVCDFPHDSHKVSSFIWWKNTLLVHITVYLEDFVVVIEDLKLHSPFVSPPPPPAQMTNNLVSQNYVSLIPRNALVLDKVVSSNGTSPLFRHFEGGSLPSCLRDSVLVDSSS